MIARQRDIDNLKRRLTEAVPRLAGQEEPEPYPLFVETNWVQITSTSQTDGRYPGSLYRRNGADATFTLVGESGGCWVDTPNAESLTTSVYYPARASGVKTDGKVIFDVIGAITGGSSFSGAKVTRSSDSSNGFITFTSELFDEGGYFTASSASMIAPSNGYYLVGCNLAWNVDVGGSARLVSVAIQHFTDATSTDRTAAFKDVKLSSGETDAPNICLVTLVEMATDDAVRLFTTDSYASGTIKALSNPALSEGYSPLFWITKLG